jgi:ankyrin repeat protein
MRRYKVCRADSPEALYFEFLVDRSTKASSSFDSVENDALKKMHSFLSSTNNVNQHFKGLQGATQLWKAAKQGHIKAVECALQHATINPNQAHKHTDSTPLYIASYYGHEGVVKALLSHPRIQVNRGKAEMTPLFAAIQEGREGVVEMLLKSKGVAVNQANARGVTPLLQACELGREYICSLLLKAPSIEVTQGMGGENIALSARYASLKGHQAIFDMLLEHEHLQDQKVSKTQL